MPLIIGIIYSYLCAWMVEMNKNNTPESRSLNETISREISAILYDIPSKKCSCTDHSRYDSCNINHRMVATNSLIVDEKVTMCGNENKQKEQTIDCLENQNCITDSHLNDKEIDGHVNSLSSASELCLSVGKKRYCKNLKLRKGNRDYKANVSSDCNIPDDSNETVSLETCEDSNSQDSKRLRRISKRKRDVEDFCPVCGVTVRYSELQNHFTKEVDNLSKISKSIKKTRLEENNGISNTFVQVKCNRENRHAAKVSKFSTRPKNEVICPVCNLKLTGPQDEINSHVLNCINEDDEFVVVDDEDSFEEYEIADQTRIRAISLVPGGYRALLGNSSKSRTADVDDEDLNVDVDDTLAYGNPQYTELDVIHNISDVTERKEMEQLWRAVLVDPTVERHVLESRKWSNECGKNENSENFQSLSEKSTAEPNAHKVKCKNIEDEGISENEAADHIVSSLKEKIRDLEEQNKNVKCLICLEPYTKPVVSTTCWHVHCEECWLMTMGVKKLCPQCNMIVFPSDLRRIYL